MGVGLSGLGWDGVGGWVGWAGLDWGEVIRVG